MDLIKLITGFVVYIKRNIYYAIHISVNFITDICI